MDTKHFAIIIVVIMGILAAIGIVSLKQQIAILKIQERIEGKLGSGRGAGKSKTSADCAAVLRKQRIIKQRLAALENQWKGLQVALNAGFDGRIRRQAKAGPGRGNQGSPPEDFTKVYDIEVAHSIIIGKKDAPVTIVEFVDFECPFCAQFHPLMVEAARAYPEKVNYIIKNFPLNFHTNAKSAAKAAFAAGKQGKYSEMVDALLSNNKILSEEKYKEIAKSLGLNVRKFLNDYKKKDAEWEDYIQKDKALGDKIGVRGTPTFYINGRKTRARDVAGFKKEIDQILKDANKQY